MDDTATDTEHFVFLLIEEFSLLAFANAVEPLRIANLVSEKELYSWSFASEAGEAVRSSSGTEMAVSHALTDVPDCSRLFLLSGTNAPKHTSQKVLSELRRLKRHGMALGALCSGSYALAASGLLDGQPAAVHWEFHDAITEKFPDVDLQPSVFVTNAPIISASGGTATADLMLHLINQKHGDELATLVADQMVYNAVRTETAQQRVSVQSRAGARSPKLAEALAIMKSELDETTSPTEVAERIGISTRQLERLFGKNLHTSPKRYLLGLKLERARHLLVQTEMSVTDIALACGFASASHFARVYRSRFGISPSQQTNALT